jgi:hypothetical protein
MTVAEQMYSWVGGVVNVNVVNINEPYTFFEIDTTDEKIRDAVLGIYKKYNLDVIEHRIGKGYHFFGGHVDRSIWREWYSELKPLNPKYPPLTLRVTKKFEGEIFERPVYHEAQNIVPHWSKAVMHFLNKTIRNENDNYIKEAMRVCGLHKYFKCVVYNIAERQNTPIGVKP